MLVLSRKKSESIVMKFGDQLATITLVQIRGDKVRIGIDAPIEVAVHRAEVWQLIQQEKEVRRERKSEC